MIASRSFRLGCHCIDLIGDSCTRIAIADSVSNDHIQTDAGILSSLVAMSVVSVLKVIADTPILGFGSDGGDSTTGRLTGGVISVSKT